MCEEKQKRISIAQQEIQRLGNGNGNHGILGSMVKNVLGSWSGQAQTPQDVVRSLEKEVDSLETLKRWV